MSVYFIIGAYIIYGLYFTINLPFKDFYHNYRAGIVLVSQGCILLASDYYRLMKSTTDPSIKARLHGLALIEMSMIVISCVFSAVVLGYDFYGWIKAQIKSNKVKSEPC